MYGGSKPPPYNYYLRYLPSAQMIISPLNTVTALPVM